MGEFKPAHSGRNFRTSVSKSVTSPSHSRRASMRKSRSRLSVTDIDNVPETFNRLSQTDIECQSKVGADGTPLKTPMETVQEKRDVYFCGKKIETVSNRRKSKNLSTTYN